MLYRPREEGGEGFSPVSVVAIVAVGFVLALAVGASASAGAPAQASREEVLRALGVDRIAADYVVMVDTSGSMKQGNLYAQVKSALRPLLRAVSPDDHLTLLTFDSTPAVRFSGPLGPQGDAALDQLPSVPAGTATDIGAAINAGLAELSRPDAHDVGTVVLVTDGKHEPPTGSNYPSTSGPAWDALGIRGRELARRHVISSYALALTPTTDAALLTRAFPNTLVEALPAGQLPGFLARVKDEARLAKARRAVAGDVSKGVEARWSGSLTNLDLNKRPPVKAKLTLHSTMTRTPLVVRGLAVTTEATGVKAGGLPGEVALAPNQTTTVDVAISYPRSGGFGLGRKQVTRSGQLRVTGSLATPWDSVLRNDLRVDLRPRLAATSTPFQGVGTVGWSWLQLLLLTLLVIAALAGARYWWLSRQPRLRGALVATPAGQPQARGTLTGRKTPIGSVKGTALKIPGHGDVRARRVARAGRRPGFDLELLIRYSAKGKASRTSVCKPNSSVVIDDVTFTYQPSGRS
jgi:hypothetical protein